MDPIKQLLSLDVRYSACHVVGDIWQDIGDKCCLLFFIMFVLYWFI